MASGSIGIFKNVTSISSFVPALKNISPEIFGNFWALCINLSHATVTFCSMSANCLTDLIPNLAVPGFGSYSFPSYSNTKWLPCGLLYSITFKLGIGGSPFPVYSQRQLDVSLNLPHKRSPVGPNPPASNSCVASKFGLTGLPRISLALQTQIRRQPSFPMVTPFAICTRHEHNDTR